MKVNNEILKSYIVDAPLALAFERTIESRIYAQLDLVRPILDLGCGEGLFAKVVFSEKIDTGIDPNPKELEEAKRLGGYKELIQCRGDAIPKPDGSYQTIISNSVLEHIPDLEPVLKEAFRLLAPGGRFYFTVPSNYFDHYTWIHQALAGLGLNGLAERYRIFFNRFWQHYHFYTLEKWQELGRKAGFEVVESFTYNSKFLCLLNSFLSPFAFPLLFVKKLTNHWILFPRLRKVMTYPFYLLGNVLLKNGERSKDGGLVFIALSKKA